MNRPRPASSAALVLAGLAGLTGLAACGAAPAAPAGGEPTLQVFDEPGYGAVVTDPSGAPLYVYSRDGRGTPRCVGPCTDDWVPLVVPDGATAQAGFGVRAGLIGTVARPGGGRQVTYDHRPVYTFLGDRTTFSLTGAGRRVDGGVFDPLRADGAVVTRRE